MNCRMYWFVIISFLTVCHLCAKFGYEREGVQAEIFYDGIYRNKYFFENEKCVYAPHPTNSLQYVKVSVVNDGSFDDQVSYITSIYLQCDSTCTECSVKEENKHMFCPEINQDGFSKWTDFNEPCEILLDVGRMEFIPQYKYLVFSRADDWEWAFQYYKGTSNSGRQAVEFNGGSGSDCLQYNNGDGFLSPEFFWEKETIELFEYPTYESCVGRNTTGRVFHSSYNSKDVLLNPDVYEPIALDNLGTSGRIREDDISFGILAPFSIDCNEDNILDDSDDICGGEDYGICLTGSVCYCFEEGGKSSKNSCKKIEWWIILLLVIGSMTCCVVLMFITVFIGLLAVLYPSTFGVLVCPLIYLLREKIEDTDEDEMVEIDINDDSDEGDEIGEERDDVVEDVDQFPDPFDAGLNSAEYELTNPGLFDEREPDDSDDDFPDEVDDETWGLAAETQVLNKSSSSLPPMPRIRICPMCLGICFQTINGCKHSQCSGCSQWFCHICLRVKEGSSWDCGSAYGECSAPHPNSQGECWEDNEVIFPIQTKDNMHKWYIGRD